ncbi:hypothetical protein SASPL_146476 [Salvia splendens]|uniref:PLAC8 family protein n=1 Tax=Salvia splendens TaxID=180675 RepID=A0A8X8Z4X8_SALSN|nr:hypothetical protein SASPL_146476 [Salvia splendens]
MTELERRGGEQAAAEEERLLSEEVSVLDFDMLCSTVAMQAQQGKWGKLNGDEEAELGYGGGVHRMWEGELFYDCLDDRRLALQSSCCPCYRFGKNMKRAGFGSCFLQGSVHLILLVIALSNLLAFTITRKCYFLYLAASFALSLGTYMGYYRIQIKKKFNIIFSVHFFCLFSKPLYSGITAIANDLMGGDTSLDDFIYHIICPSCMLSQVRIKDVGNEQCPRWDLAWERGHHMRGKLLRGQQSILGVVSTLCCVNQVPTTSQHATNLQRHHCFADFCGRDCVNCCLLYHGDEGLSVSLFKLCWNLGIIVPKLKGK